MVVNGSWAQTSATLLDAILDEIKNESSKLDNIGDIINSIEPVVNVNVQPPVNNININVQPAVNNIFVNMDELVAAVNELKLEVSKMKPIVIINNKCFSKNDIYDRSRCKPDKPIRKPPRVDNNVVYIGEDDWIVVPPGTLKSGYLDSVNYKIRGGIMRSAKLFWLISGNLREVMIAVPKVNSKEYYDSAKLEAKQFLGVDL